MEENNLAPFVSQWMTIQPSLFDYLGDEIGELDDEDPRLHPAPLPGPAPPLRMGVPVEAPRREGDDLDDAEGVRGLRVFLRPRRRGRRRAATSPDRASSACSATFTIRTAESSSA